MHCRWGLPFRKETISTSLLHLVMKTPKWFGFFFVDLIFDFEKENAPLCTDLHAPQTVYGSYMFQSLLIHFDAFVSVMPKVTDTETRVVVIYKQSGPTKYILTSAAGRGSETSVFKFAVARSLSKIQCSIRRSSL